jgi:NADH:ubiquinone reductase (H+-translocating)
MESAAHKDTHILILGSGFAAVEVVKKLQKEFHNNKNIRISLVSKDNFILFNPMLPEVASGMIEVPHVVTPVRSFCVLLCVNNFGIGDVRKSIEIAP